MRTAYSNYTKETSVESMLKELKLDHVADNTIGSLFHKALSGGERKRVCIGIELISDPSILLLDEPTSGLDSNTAELVVDLLKTKTSEGRTVILTIHQPGSSIFFKLDKLLLMSVGNILYQGKPSESTDYFRQLGYECPEFINPPDYFMEILYVKNRYKKTTEEEEILGTCINAYNYVTDPVVSEGREPFERILEKELGCVPSWRTRIFTVFRRALVSSSRNPILTIVELAQSIAIVIGLTTMFIDIDDDYDSFQERSGLLFVLAMYQVWIGNQDSCLSCNSYTVPIEKAVYFKEYGQGLYSCALFLIVKMLVELPYLFLSPIIVSLGIYWSVNINQGDIVNFFIFCTFYLVLAMLLARFSGFGFGYIAGIMFDDIASSIGATPYFLALSVMLGGFLASSDSFSDLAKWLKYLSPFYFGFHTLAINEFEDLDLDCACVDPGCECRDPLAIWGLDDSSAWHGIIGQVCVGLGIRLIAYILLLTISKRRHG